MSKNDKGCIVLISHEEMIMQLAHGKEVQVDIPRV